jgi:hypothetical protein
LAVLDVNDALLRWSAVGPPLEARAKLDAMLQDVLGCLADTPPDPAAAIAYRLAGCKLPPRHDWCCVYFQVQGHQRYLTVVTSVFLLACCWSSSAGALKLQVSMPACTATACTCTRRIGMNMQYLCCQLLHAVRFQGLTRSTNANATAHVPMSAASVHAQ